MTTTPNYAEKSIHRTQIDAPIETVWSILVATDKPLPFFFGSICDTIDGLKPGAKMRMVHPNRKIAMVVGEVLAFEPPHRYSHTFKMTNLDDDPCIVTYELRENDGGTEFDLIIENAVEGSNSFQRPANLPSAEKWSELWHQSLRCWQRSSNASKTGHLRPMAAP